MRNTTLFSIVAAGTVLACGWAAAGERLAGLPRRHSAAALDSEPVTATLDSGAAWSAWAYRISGEYAIALSFRDLDGVWSDPSFIGVDDRLDQIEPALAVDADGNLYLAFAVRETGVIFVSALRAETQRWFVPQQVTLPTERAGSPTLRVVGDRLVMGYRVGREVRLLDWALLSSYVPPGGMTTDGIQDGPDGFPLAVAHEGSDDDDDGNHDDDREQPGSGSEDTGGGPGQMGLR